MSARTMIFLIFIVVTLILPTVHSSLQITDHEFPLMHYTKLISEEHFTPGSPLLIVLPLAEEKSSNKEEGYLIEELHASGRWPILVYNVGYKMNGNMYTEIHQHGSYIILISGPCKEWEEHIAHYIQQLYEMSVGNSTGHLWNPSAKFFVSVMSRCTHKTSTNFLIAALNELWYKKVINFIVLSLKPNKHAGNDLQQNTSVSAQSTYLELHTWYPYENSDRCNSTEGTVQLKV